MLVKHGLAASIRAHCVWNAVAGIATGALMLVFNDFFNNANDDDENEDDYFEEQESNRIKGDLLEPRKLPL